MSGQLWLFDAPPPAPATQAARLGEAEGWERVTIDPASSATLEAIEASHSCMSIAMEGKVLRPFRFRGAEWVCTGSGHHRGASSHTCYRVVEPAAFIGPNEPQPYGTHDFHRAELRAQFGSYHGMASRHAKRPIIIEGPPIEFQTPD